MKTFSPYAVTVNVFYEIDYVVWSEKLVTLLYKCCSWYPQQLTTAWDQFFFTPVYFSAFVEDNELKSFLEEKGIRF